MPHFVLTTAGGAGACAQAVTEPTRARRTAGIRRFIARAGGADAVKLPCLRIATLRPVNAGMPCRVGARVELGIRALTEMVMSPQRKAFLACLACLAFAAQPALSAPSQRGGSPGARPSGGPGYGGPARVRGILRLPRAWRQPRLPWPFGSFGVLRWAVLGLGPGAIGIPWGLGWYGSAAWGYPYYPAYDYGPAYPAYGYSCALRRGLLARRAGASPRLLPRVVPPSGAGRGWRAHAAPAAPQLLRFRPGLVPARAHLPGRLAAHPPGIQPGALIRPGPARRIPPHPRGCACAGTAAARARCACRRASRRAAGRRA